MTKFINKYSFISVICILLFFFTANRVYASTEYYSKLLKKWGITTNSFVTSTDSVEELFNDINTPFLLTTSSINDNSINHVFKMQYKYVILVCDNNFESEWLACDQNKVEIKDRVFSKVDLGNKQGSEERLEIYTLSINGVGFIILSSDLFFTPAYSENLQEYFRYFLKSSYFNHSLDVQTLDSSNVLSSSSDLLNISSIFVLLAFLFVFFTRFLINLTNGDFKFKIIILLDFVNDLVRFLLKLKPLLSVLLILMVLGIIVFVPFVPWREALSYESFERFIELKESRTILEFELKDLMNAFILLYILIFAVISILFIIPDLLNYFPVFNNKIFSKRLNLKFVKIMVPLLLFVILLNTVIFKLDSKTTIFATFCILYLVRFSTGIRNMYSVREKILLLVIFIIPLIFAFNTQVEDKEKSYVYEDLIGSRDGMVVLPYRKVSSINALYNKFDVKSEFNIFVDNYLVYSPNYAVIKHRDLESFDEINQNFVFVDVIDAEFVKKLTNNESLRKNLVTDGLTRFIYLNNKDLKSIKNLTMKIDINCEEFQVESSSVITLESLDLGGAQYTVLNFAGCITDQVETFVVPLKISNTESTVYKISGINLLFLKDVRILNGREEVVSQFINVKESGEIFLQNLNIGSEVTVYSAGIKDFDFTTKVKGSIDISERVNYLRQNGYIDENFLIWSDIFNATFENTK